MKEKEKFIHISRKNDFIRTDTIKVDFYKCPKCKSVNYDMNQYCRYCGIKLVWVE